MPSINDGNERVRVAGREIQDSSAGLLPRLREYTRRSDRPLKGEAARFLDERIQRRSQIIYRDRPDLVRYDSPRTVYVYRDGYDRLCERIIWPQYYYPVYYSYGSYLGFRCVYPYYQRKYVFVSLGGYWPSSYNYMRYYWYGYHPYTWYGYHPVPRQVTSDTYNYYTYNYYTDSYGQYADTAYYSGDTGRSDLPYGISAQTYARVQQRVAEQDVQAPAAQTQVDTLFDAGVQSFEAGRYHEAIDQFGAAMELAPDDMILPYAYTQALFAGERYAEAAAVLREALMKVSPTDEGVFYPRGLYADDDILFEQIEELLDEVEDYGFDADMQLLLGYNLLGVGENEYARGPLERAVQDARNVRAAKVLLNLLDKLDAAEAGSTVDVSALSQTGASAPAPASAQSGVEQPVVQSPAQATAEAALVPATPEPATNDTDEASSPAGLDINVPSLPADTEPAGETEAQPLDLVPGVVPPSAILSTPPETLDSGTQAAALIGWSATPVVASLIAGAAFCLVRGEVLGRQRMRG
jgi:tetratricopeptide (TPR) repeat protein